LARGSLISFSKAYLEDISMKKAMLVVTFLVLAGALKAEDPMVGTWKANLSKSKVPAAMSAKLATISVAFRELDADTYELTAQYVLKDGSTAPAYKLTVPKAGGMQTYQQGGPGKGVSVVTTWIDPYTHYNTYLENGKQVSLMRVNFSKDGKSYTATQDIKDDQGNSSLISLLYERQ
jgi:hypothetical protein